MHQSSFKKVLFMWSILLFGYFLSIFHSLVTAILQPHLMKDFGLSATAVTTIGSMFFYTYLLMQIPTGLLADKYGAKKTALGGLIVASLGAFCFASASNTWMLSFGRGLVGLGISTIFVCVLKFQVAWMHPNILATMTGIACFVGALGGIVAQSPLVFLVDTFGWRVSMYGIGFISLLNAVFVFIWVQDSPSPSPRKEENQKNDSRSIFTALVKIIFDWRTWPPVSTYTVFYGSYVALVGYSGTSWLIHSHSLSAMQASSYLIAAVIGSAFGFVVLGFWSDRIANRKIPLLVGGALYTLCWFFLAFFGNKLSPLPLLLLLFGIGFFSCAFVVSFACVQEINPQKYSGIASAVVNMGGYIGPIIIPELFVFIQNSQVNSVAPESFSKGFEYIFYSVILCLVFSLLTKEPPRKEAQKK